MLALWILSCFIFSSAVLGSSDIKRLKISINEKSDIFDVYPSSYCLENLLKANQTITYVIFNLTEKRNEVEDEILFSILKSQRTSVLLSNFSNISHAIKIDLKNVHIAWLIISSQIAQHLIAELFGGCRGKIYVIYESFKSFIDKQHTGIVLNEMTKNVDAAITLVTVVKNESNMLSCESTERLTCVDHISDEERFLNVFARTFEPYTIMDKGTGVLKFSRGIDIFLIENIAKKIGMKIYYMKEQQLNGYKYNDSFEKR